MNLLIKSTFTLIAFVCITKVVSAQTVNSGAMMIGGTMGFNSIDADSTDDSETYFNLSPSFGYYVINDLAFGARLSWTMYSYAEVTNYSFGIGPWVRYYIVNSSLFAQGGVDFGTTGFDFFSLITDAESSTVNLGVGYSWFINDAVAIEPLLQYSIYNAYEEGGDYPDYNRFGFNISVQAFLGRN